MSDITINLGNIFEKMYLLKTSNYTKISFKLKDVLGIF